MAAALCVILCLGMLPVPAFAAEWQSTCPHDLRQHDESCNYVEAVGGVPCGHTEHDENCGFVEAVAEIPCDKGCAETDGDGNIIHAADCAYTPAVESAPCKHEQGTHDESCGYVEAVASSPCQHVHDESCGGLETPPAPGIVCDLCGGDHEAADCPEAAAPMALTASGIPALDSSNAYQNVKYTLSTDGANTAIVYGAVSTSAVTGEGNKLVIPAQVQKGGTVYDVTSIAQDAFTDCSALASVAVPESVTSIGEAAFYSIKAGAVVTFTGPATLTQVHTDALKTSAKKHLYVVAQGDRLVSLNAALPTSIRRAGYGMLVAEPPQSTSFENPNPAGTLKAADSYLDYAAYGIYNVQGLKNDTVIRTTRSDQGYSTYLSTDADPDIANAKAVAFPGEGEESYVNGVWVKVTTDFVSGGNYLRVTYTLRSGTGAEIQNVSLGVHADVQIGKDDKASIFPTPTGFRMVNTKTAQEDSDGSGMQFTLNCKNAPGADDVDTMWYGGYGYEDDNLFTNLVNKPELIGKDSALAFSWQNMTVPAKGEITRSVLFGVGESAAPPALPSDPGSKPIALYLTTSGEKNITVNAKVTDVRGVTDTLYYTINDGEEQKLGETVTADDTEKTIAGIIGAENFPTDGEYVINLWIMNSKGAMSEVISKTLTVTSGTMGGGGLEEGVAPVGPPTLPAVASVTTADSTVTEYADFTAALTAAKATAGSTLKLLDNVTLPDGALNQQDYDMSGTYTLDLAAYTLDVGQKTGVNDRKNPKITSGAVTVTGTTGKIVGYCANAPLISVGGTGTLNLIGGTLQTTEKSPAVVVGPGGTLNVSENAAVEDTYNAYPSSNGGAIKNQGTVNVKGGKVSSQRGLAILNSSAGGSNPAAVLTISGGTVTSGADKYDSTGMDSDYCTVSNSGTLHITGGTITSQRNYAVYVSNSLTTPAYLSGTPTLTGGMGEVYLGGPGVLYANDNRSSPAYYTGKALRVTGNILNNDYSPIKEGGQIVRGVKTGEGGNAEKFTLTNPGYLLELSDSDLLLKKAPPQVKWGTGKDNLTNSGLLTEALAAKPAYMQLQEDISFDETVKFPYASNKPYTLDLNGYNLTQTNGAKAAIQCEGPMTLCDSTAKTVDGVYTSGKIAGGYIGVTIVYGGNFTMESGSICDRGSYSSNTGIETRGNSLTLKGGYIGGNSYADVEVESKAFVLAGRMEEPISVRCVNGKAGDTVITSDGTYEITTDNLARFTSADPAFGLVLEGTGTAAVVKLVAIPEAKWGTDDSYAVGSGTFAQAVIYANGLESGTAYIQLQRDVSRTSTVTFNADKTTVLDLNGCTLAGNHVFSVLEVKGNLTMKDSGTGGAVVTGSSPSYAAGGVSVSEGGQFTLESGKIGPTLGTGVSVSGSTEKPALFTMTGGSICRNKGLGVRLSNDTTFNMSDGKITGNGGGVEVSTRGTFHMSGGEITGNNATAADTGGGVTFVANGAAVNLSGSAKITGNVKNGTLNAETGLYTGGTPCNVYLGYNQYSGERKIGGGGFTTGASIGVTVANLPTTGDRQITSISGAGDYAAVFTSDDPAYEVFNKGTETVRNAYLRKPVAPPPAHTDHPVCGGNSCLGNHTGHESRVTYTELTQAMLDGANYSGAPLGTGNYYLAGDLTVQNGNQNIYISGNINLCLNGHTLNLGGNQLVQTGGTLNLCDCQGGGKILRSSSSAVGMSAMFQCGNDEHPATLNLYGGTLENKVRGSNNMSTTALSIALGSTANLYGGTVTQTNTDSATQYLKRAIDNGGALNLYGGTVSNATGLPISAAGDMTLSGSPTITAGDSIRHIEVAAGGSFENPTFSTIHAEGYTGGPLKVGSSQVRYGNDFSVEAYLTSTLIVCKSDGSNKDKFTVTTAKANGAELTVVAVYDTAAHAWIVKDKAPALPTETPVFEAGYDIRYATDDYNQTTVNFYHKNRYITERTYQLYTSATGDAQPNGITASPDDLSFKVVGITQRTELWVSVTEQGKTESGRTKITALPNFSSAKNSYLYLKNAQELADYLNYCEPNSATVQGDTVTMSKNAMVLHYLYFGRAGDEPETQFSYRGVLNLNGHTLSKGPDLASSDVFALLGAGSSLTLRGGTFYDGIYCGEKTTLLLENCLLQNEWCALESYGTVELTNTTVEIVNNGQFDDPENGGTAAGTCALIMDEGGNLTIHSGTLKNAFPEGYTYIGPQNLADCIAEGSVSVPANSSAYNGGDSYFEGMQACQETVTVTVGSPAYTYTVTFDSQGAETAASPATKIVVSPATTVGTLPTLPTKTGYTFGGWFTAENGAGTEFTASTKVTGNLTVYAKWTVKPVTPAQGGEVALPLTQDNLDRVFGEGNAEIGNTTPPTIHIKDDITASDTIIIPGDVTIDLGGHTITGPDGKPAIIVKGEDSDVIITGPGSIHGGDGIGPNGDGGAGIENNGTGDSTVTIGGGTEISGGNGSGSGSGGPGIDSGNGGGDVVVGGDSSVNGGQGGGAGGTGGDGISGGSGSDVIVGSPDNGTGSVTGGDGGNNPGGTGGSGGDGIHTGGDIAIGGDGSAQGGNGGNGSSGGTGGNGTNNTGSGDTTIADGGSATGGQGGSGSASGGDGGNGSSIGGGSNTVNGDATGGTGGSGTGGGQAGDGGNGLDGSGAVDGTGSATGGNGGNAETDGKGGTGGSAMGDNVTGGDSLDKNNGKNGLNAKVEIKGNPGTEVKIPDAGAAADAVLTEDEKQNDKITEVTVTLTVENKTESKPNEEKIEEKLSGIAADTVGAYFDITLEKTVKETGKNDATTSVTETNSKITVTITIPADMRGGSNYTIIRVHTQSGTTTAEVIVPTRSGNDLTFETDKFSTYAIAYTPAGGGDPTPPTPPTPDYGGGSTPSYKPDVTKPDHGSVTVTPTYPSKGDTVTITTKPDEGYVVDRVTVTDRDGKTVAVAEGKDGKYTFTQPSGKVTIDVRFESAEVRPAWGAFTDVSEGDWFYESVKYVYEKGLMNGTASDKFSPYTTTSRGMIVTILWRLEGEPEATTTAPFPDVAADSYCAVAVAWGAENGIVNGYTNGNFGPNDPITREQFAAILYRYAQFKGMVTTAANDLTQFVDQPDPWAAEAMRWVVGAGIISGKGGNILDPTGKATREQAAAMLMRFLTNQEK